MEVSDTHSKRLTLEDITIRGAAENRFTHVAHQLRWTVREDALRVFYPLYFNDLSWPPRWLSDIRTQENVAGGVSRVQFGEEKRFYISRDAAVIQQELQNLKLFGSVPNIVQLFYVVISTNPYLTRTLDDNLTVIRGILLEHHPGGTLGQPLDKMDVTNFPWRQWPLQIGHGLLNLHQKNVMHMDLKPSNTVIDSRGNAVIIDVSSIRGTTYECVKQRILCVVRLWSHALFLNLTKHRSRERVTYCRISGVRAEPLVKPKDTL